MHKILYMLLIAALNVPSSVQSANPPSQKDTVAHHAASMGHLEAFDFHDAQKNVNTPGINGNTPAHDAAAHNHPRIIQRLFDLGANINAKNIFGAAPIHTAAMFGHTAAIQKLSDLNADINSRDNFGNTPAHIAAELGHINVLELLSRLGANLKAINNDGDTLAHKAAKYGKLETLKWLHSKGIDINTPNKKGFTPADIAKKYNRSEVANWLNHNQQTKIDSKIDSLKDVEIRAEAQARTKAHFDEIMQQQDSASDKQVRVAGRR